MKQFDAMLVKTPNRNVFDLSHEVKLTCDMGELIPILTQEVYPNETFKCDSSVLVRFAPLLAPIMHRIDVFVHFFFVPNRIIWDDWEDFITKKADATPIVEVPTVEITETTKSYFQKGSLADYMGIPPTDGLTISTEYEINSLPFLAYQKIWWEYYRDQNLDGTADNTFEEIMNTYQNFMVLQKRAWEKDYFTSCLPWAQKGEEVILPVGETAPIEWQDNATYGSRVRKADDGTLQTSMNQNILTDAGFGILIDATPDNLGIDITENHFVDLSNAVGISVNEFRVSLRLQEWMEKNARMGSRYSELLLAHFGVRSSDARLQRPEYLGGGKQPVTVSEVVSTVASRSVDSGTEDDILSPQGDMSGHAISVGRSNQFEKFFEEHGWVIGIMSVRPRTAYQDGIHKMFWRKDYMDYMWPSFAQLGEQEVMNVELCVDYQQTEDIDYDTFGYQSRYAELKYMSDRVCADMRDDYDHWHLGRQFFAGDFPSLDSEFITCEPDKRIFAVEEEDLDSLIVQIYHSLYVKRPLPYFNIPSII